jgi:hypothetical protein
MDERLKLGILDDSKLMDNRILTLIYLLPRCNSVPLPLK